MDTARTALARGLELDRARCILYDGGVRVSYR